MDEAGTRADSGNPETAQSSQQQGADDSRANIWMQRMRQALQVIRGTVLLRLPDAAGVTKLSILNSANAEVAQINSLGVGTFLGGITGAQISDATALATANKIVLRDGSAGAAFALVTANGIVFPATQVASAGVNTLDDYEEGTWTPAWGGVGGDPTVTYSTQTGIYIKIGRVVLLGGALGTATKSGGSGSLLVRGFPFTVGTNYGSEGLISSTATFNWGATAAPQIGAPVKTAANMQLFMNDSSDGRSGLGTNVTTAQLTATAVLIFGGYYLVD